MSFCNDHLEKELLQKYLNEQIPQGSKLFPNELGHMLKRFTEDMEYAGLQHWVREVGVTIPSWSPWSILSR